MPKPAKTKSLSRQLLWRVIAYTVILTIPLSVINVAINFQQESNRQREQLKAMVALTINQLGEAIWTFDQKRVREILDSLTNLPALQTVQVRTPYMVEIYTKPNTADQPNIPFQVYFPKAPNSNLVLGELWVKLDNAAILASIQSDMARSLLGLAFQLACMAALMYWLLRRFLTIPVLAIANHVIQLQPDHLADTSPNFKLKYSNELSQLADGIGRLQLAVRNYVSELEEVNRNLLVSQRQNSALIQAIPDLIFINNLQGEFLAVFGSSSGFIPPEIGPLVGKRLSDVLPDKLADQYMRVLGQAIVGQAVQVFEFPLTIGQTDFYFEARIARLDGESAVTIIRDITASKQAIDEIYRLNAQLEQRVASRTRELQASLNSIEKLNEAILVKEKLASLTPIVAMVSHELNTPIGNIAVLSSALLEQCDELAKGLASHNQAQDFDRFLKYVRESGELIMTCARSAGDLIRSFKKVSVDREGAQVSKFDLSTLIHDIVALVKLTFKHAPVEIIADIPDGIILESYPGPLGQVVDNLIRNALIHGFDPEDQGHIWVQASLDGQDSRAVAITVMDDGKGIPKANQKKVFDPFFTTNMANSSSGLGLSICYNIAHNVLGGILTLEELPITHTMPGRTGSCFRLVIPLQPIHP